MFAFATTATTTTQVKRETAAAARFAMHCGTAGEWRNRDARNAYQGKEGNQT